eukprot:2811841-Prymnesium_polylepis.1
MVVGSAKQEAARCAVRSAHCRKQCAVAFASPQIVGDVARSCSRSRCAAPATLGHAPFAPAPLTLAA